MTIIDSHCHLYLPEFQNDVDEVIHRAKSVGVEKFLLPNIDSSTISPLKELSNKYSQNCFPMMGLHPTSVNADFEKELSVIEKELKTGNYIAVGEIGIDLYWDKTFVDQQKHVFRKQIVLAKEMNLPIVIHARESFNEIFEIVEELNDDRLTGIFHCFTGNEKDAERIIDFAGFKMGIGGVVTFKNGGLDKFLSNVDLQHIVLETDSPYLAPVPHRGKRNESSYLSEIINKLADIYSKSTEEIAEITTKNCLDLFDLK